MRMFDEAARLGKLHDCDRDENQHQSDEIQAYRQVNQSERDGQRCKQHQCNQ